MGYKEWDVLEADELTALAQLDLESDRLDRALAKLKRAVALGAPGESRAMLGRLYARLGLLERAKQILAKYIEEHPQDLFNHVQCAMVCLDIGDLDTASDMLQHVLALQPEHPPALYHKALLLARTAEKEQALSTLDILLKSAGPDNLFHGKGTELKVKIEGTSGQTSTFFGAPAGKVVKQ